MKNKLFLLMLFIAGSLFFPSLKNNSAAACDKICAASCKAIKKEAIKKMEAEDTGMDNSLREFPFSFSN